MQKDLRLAVIRALEQGHSSQEVKTTLEKGGWSPEEIQEVLQSLIVGEKGAVLPVRKPVTFAKESYLYLMQAIAYIAVSISMLVLWFQYLNLWLPDALSSDYSYTRESAQSLIRTGLSILIVAFPVFAYVSHLIREMEASFANAPQNTTKQGVLYLMSFVASMVAIITLMVTVFQGLNGEATLRFFAKVVGILALCGWTGWIARRELALTKPTTSSQDA